MIGTFIIFLGVVQPPSVFSDKVAVVQVIKEYYKAWKKRDYAKLLKLTVGHEHKRVSKMVAHLKRYRKLPRDWEIFLNRVKNIEVSIDDVDVIPQLNRAYVECKYIFSGPRPWGLRKKRVVSYVLLNVNGQWKIEYSKALQEVFER